VVWDKRTGEPVAPAIVWQCRRTAAYCDALKPRELIEQKTGLVIDAYFSASKIRWIIDYAPGKADDLLFGNVDTWLIWKLTNGAAHVTDLTNASRTMLMNLETGEWDPELLSVFGLPPSMLPKIVPSTGICGIAAKEHFGAEIPIAGIAGDQQAALFGQACFKPGLSKNTYGTGCFALMHAGGHVPVSKHRLLATRAASPDARPQFAVEGSVFIAGAAVQWLRDKLQSFQVRRSQRPLPHRCRIPAEPTWSRRSSDWVRRIGIRTRVASCPESPRAPIRLDWCARPSRASRIKCAIWCKRWRPTAGKSFRNCAWRRSNREQLPDAISGRHSRSSDRSSADIETTALGAAYLAGLATGFFKSTGELGNVLEGRSGFLNRR